MEQDSISLPPFVKTINGQQPCSHLQASFYVHGDIKTFQVPLLSLDDSDVLEAVTKLKTEVLAVSKV